MDPRSSNLAFPGGAVIKNLPVNAGDPGDRSLIPGLERSAGGGMATPLQYSCLGNPMDRGTWQATVHLVAKLDTTEATEHSTQHHLIRGINQKNYFLSSDVTYHNKHCKTGKPFTLF